MNVFWISLTLWLSNKPELRGIFQVALELIKLEIIRLVEFGEPGMIGGGEKEGIDGI